jgi:hypothetical protein
MSEREVIQNLNRVAERLPRAVAVGLYGFALEVLRKAQRLVPVDTGFLRNSAFVRQPEWNGQGFKVSLGYRAPYAIFVHEGPHSSGRKWLEKAFNAFSGSAALEIIATVVEQEAPRLWANITAPASEFGDGN